MYGLDAETDRRFRPQLPDCTTIAGARRAIRADLERRRQWLSTPQLGQPRRSLPATTATMAAGMDQPAAALIQDLKARGMLDDTIVIWTTEFGRMPCSQGAKDAIITPSRLRRG